MSESEATSDPLDGVHVRLSWEAGVVAGVRRIGPLRRSTQVVTYRDGLGGPEQKVPGRTEYDAVVVELDVGHDRAFEEWAGSSLAAAGDVPADDVRRTLRIELHDASGEVVLAYDLYRCWVSQYQALPDVGPDAGAAPAMFARIECDGWARDFSVPDPPPPIDP